MSSDVAISLENLSKCYELYDKPHHRLMQMACRGHKQFYREFWALRGVSLEVRKGETVGILGKNGSGKSTLLKMICGTLNPSGGTIQTNGRIAAILELGSGFNPEFTGRENVYMKGAILGLNRQEIDQRFQAIADFAELGDFMDQLVRTYSSGMMIRLAFAVSISMDPDILIIDEALSVGDEKFQRKCFSRIEAIRDAGSTILFVSHSGGTVVQLCDQAVLLDHGEKIATGIPKTVTGYVQDVTPYFEQARVFMSPLLYGAGVKGKIGRSIGCGLPVVSTPIGAEGMPLTQERDILVGETAEAFAEQVIRLYRDQELWETIAIKGAPLYIMWDAPSLFQKVNSG